MPSQAKHWQFTLNNPTQDERLHLVQIGTHHVDTPIEYLIFGNEVGASGTPHLQGHVSFRSPLRLPQVKTLIADRAHFEVVRLLQRHIEYCKKDGDYHEFGSPPTREASHSGERRDLAEFRTTVEDGVYDSPTLREKHPTIMARYPGFAAAVVRDLYPKPPGPTGSLRPWQQHLVDLCAADPDPRKILFVVNPRGNAGKTYAARYLSSRCKTVQILRVGRVADMAHAYKVDTTVLIVDVPKSKGEFLQYDFLEQVKDGYLMSSKYNSHMKVFKPPHVIVMMNEEPDRTKLSHDRFKYIYID